MKVDEISYADVVVLKLAGRVDQENSPALQRRLGEVVTRLGQSRMAGLVIDMANVPYMSSAGLRVLMFAAKETKAASMKLAVAGLRPVVREVFQISRFDKVIPVHDKLSAALEAISGPAAAAYSSQDAAGTTGST
ncbi:MAG: STAS domain-containing protein [Alphaproteobacteria bacterium]